MKKGLTREQQEKLDKLTKLQQNVCLKSLEGLSDIDAYRQGGGKAKTIQSQSQCAGEIMNNPEVKEFLNSVKESIVKDTIMNREEALERLTVIARGDISKLVNFRTIESKDAEGNKIRQAGWDIPDSADQDNDQLSTISEVTAGRDGVKIKQHSPMNAIKQLSDMEGWNSPKELIVSPMKQILEDLSDGNNGLPD